MSSTQQQEPHVTTRERVDTLPSSETPLGAAPATVTVISLPETYCEKGRWYEATKRLTDVVGALLALFLLSPVYLLAILAIKISDRGPVFFEQTRVGRGGRHFECIKFRSMVVDAESLKSSLKDQNHHKDGVTFKIREDPRMTAVGWLLRKTSIDELPQFWNVLVGDMSLVGPRPPIPDEVARYTPQQLRRLEVRPGLTCIWQVSGRGDVAFSEQVKMDIEYIERRSLWLDLKLLLLTIPAVLSCKGAY